MTAQTAAPAVGTAEPVAPTPPARMAAGLAVVVALLGGLLGTGGQLDGLLGGNAITVASGRVEAQVADGWIPVRIGARVQPGTTLRVAEGRATLGVPGGTVDLAEGSRVTVDDRLRVEAGTVVVHGSRTVVGDEATRVQGTDTWRYDAAGRTTAYTGSVVVTDAADREVLVRSLQEARLRDGILTVEPRPYVYTDTDAFDRQYLATAFDVDDYLAALRQGLQAEYGTAPQVTAFYTDFDGLDGSLVDALGDIGFDHVGARVGPPADVLVASVVTEALVVDAGLAPEVAADRVRDLRLAGATWGLVVQGHDLDASHVRAAADRALARRQLAEQQGTAAPVDQGQAPSGTPSGAPAEGAPANGSTATPPGTGERQVDPDVGGGEPVPPAPDGPGGGAGPVEDVVDESGADEAVDGEAGDLVDDVVETTDGVVGDVEEETGKGVDALDPPLPTDTSSPSPGAVGDAVDEVGSTVDGAVDAVDDAVDEVGSPVDAVDEVGSPVDAVDDAVDSVGSAVDDVETGVGSLLGD